MTTKEELQDTYAKFTTQKLLELLDQKHNYTDLAITVALDELSKREVTEEVVGDYKATQVHKLSKYIQQSVIEDLKLWQKALYYIFFVPIFNLPFRQNLSEEGYVLKLRQATYYSWAGFFGLFVSGVLTSVVTVDTGNLRSLIIWAIIFVIAAIYDERFNRQKLINKLRREFPIETDITDEGDDEQIKASEVQIE